MSGFRDVALPNLEVSELPSGLRLVCIQKRGVPLFHVRLSLPAGASADPTGKSGLAQFTADLLRRGTRRRDARAVDELIDVFLVGTADIHLVLHFGKALPLGRFPAAERFANG